VTSLLAIDPLLDNGLKWTPIVLILVKVVVIFVIGLVGTMFMVWFERKIIAGMQNRVGPNKAGPYGLLQTLADGMKLIFKEDFMPDRADRWVYRLAPFLAFVPAFLVWPSQVLREAPILFLLSVLILAAVTLQRRSSPVSMLEASIVTSARERLGSSSI
jgi:NADH:ubiquinone oxidoreductase subunit H